MAFPLELPDVPEPAVAATGATMTIATHSAVTKPRPPLPQKALMRVSPLEGFPQKALERVLPFEPRSCRIESFPSSAQSARPHKEMVYARPQAKSILRIEPPPLVKGARDSLVRETDT